MKKYTLLIAAGLIALLLITVNSEDAITDTKRKSAPGPSNLYENTEISGFMTPATKYSESDSQQTVINYTTQSGDTLFSIADHFGLRPETILVANELLLNDPSIVDKPGVEIRIPTVDGFFYIWRAGDTIEEVAKTYGTNVEAIVNWSGNDLDPANPEASLTPGKEIFLPGGFPKFQIWRGDLGPQP